MSAPLSRVGRYASTPRHLRRVSGVGYCCRAVTPRSGLGSTVLLVGDGEAVVQLVGEIDLSAKCRLIEALTEAAADRRRLVIDVSDTSFIDSTGLKGAGRRLADADGRWLGAGGAGAVTNGHAYPGDRRLGSQLGYRAH